MQVMDWKVEPLLNVTLARRLYPNTLGGVWENFEEGLCGNSSIDRRHINWCLGFVVVAAYGYAKGVVIDLDGEISPQAQDEIFDNCEFGVAEPI